MTAIRKASLEDLQLVVEVFDQYRIFYEKESDKEKAREFIHERLTFNDSRIYVAESNDKNIIGFVQLYPIFSSTRMQRLWLLNDLFVDKEYRGKGISKLLMEAAKELCKETNACGLLLETAKSNIIGNQLYPKLGFSLETDHNYYYWNKN